MLVSAPDTSGFLLPTWEDTEQYSDGASSISSFSSNVLKSIVSEMSADQLLCDDRASDLEGDDANFSDCYDDGTDDDDDDNDDDNDDDDDDGDGCGSKKQMMMANENNLWWIQDSMKMRLDKWVIPSDRSNHDSMVDKRKMDNVMFVKNREQILCENK